MIAWALSAIAILLAVAHLIFSLNYHYVEPRFPAETILYVLFDLTGEVTIPTWYSSSLLLAAWLYVGGALGVEVIEAAYDSRFDYRAPYLIMVAIEETLEMLGVIVLLSALLSYASSFTRGVQVSLD